jgi:hypothetical protein
MGIGKWRKGEMENGGKEKERWRKGEKENGADSAA